MRMPLRCRRPHPRSTVTVRHAIGDSSRFQSIVVGYPNLIDPVVVVGNSSDLDVSRGGEDRENGCKLAHVDHGLTRDLDLRTGLGAEPSPELVLGRERDSAILVRLNEER